MSYISAIVEKTRDYPRVVLGVSPRGALSLMKAAKGYAAIAGRDYVLPDDIKLGLYECPHPYKRLVTPKILDWCISTGKFRYMKDTCCDAKVIAERCAQLRGTGFTLLNANCQTLLETMRNGCDGYCGIMCNFHPKLYAWLGNNYETQPEKADFIQGIIGTFGYTESPLPYPLTAKYHMNLCGIPTENIARNRDSELLTDYVKSSMKQMKCATDELEKMLGI